MKHATTLLAAAFLVFATPAFAAVDGTLDGAYGPIIVGQTTQTQFGDSNLGSLDYANGSELDNAYAYISGGVLHLFLGGNLESNFNKLELFFDVFVGAGQNQLRNDNPNVDFNGLNNMAGLRFDPGVDPDFWVGLTCGGGPFQLYANYSELLTLGGGTGYYLGSANAGPPGTLGGGFNPNGIEATVDNSWTGPVTGGCGPDDGTPANTGVEVTVPLSALGNPAAGCYRIVAFINGSGHDFLSNQVLGPLPPGTCNLGAPAGVDFGAHVGAQYFEVCTGETPARGTSWGRLKTIYR